MLVGQRSSSIAPKGPTIPSIATDASISVTIRSTGKLESIVEAVSVCAWEVSVGVATRRPVSLGNTHNAQTPVLLYKRSTDHREPVSGCILLWVTFPLSQTPARHNLCFPQDSDAHLCFTVVQCMFALMNNCKYACAPISYNIKTTGS